MIVQKQDVQHLRVDTLSISFSEYKLDRTVPSSPSSSIYGFKMRFSWLLLFAILVKNKATGQCPNVGTKTETYTPAGKATLSLIRV